MRGLGLTLLVASLALGGCLGGADDKPPTVRTVSPDGGGSAHASGTGTADSPGLPPPSPPASWSEPHSVPPVDPSPSLRPTLAFEWNTTSFVGDGAVRVQFDLATTAKCKFVGGAENEGPVSRLASIGLLRWSVMDQFWYNWVYVYPGHAAHAHATAYGDSRPLTGPGSGWGSYIEFTAEMNGRVDFTLAGLNLRAWGSDVTDGRPLFLTIDCDQAMTNFNFFVGNEVILFTDETVTDGAGASHAQAGSLSVQGSMGAGFTLPLVEAVAGSRGTDAGSLRVETPIETVEWDLFSDSSEFYWLSGEAGDYAMTLDYASVGSETYFWGGLIGLKPVGNLDEINDL